MAKKQAEIRVVVSKDGPYIVTGNVPLSQQTIGTDAEGGSEKWIEGKTFPVRQTYSLCRCGQSKTKPFCDDTHARIKFDGTETAGREPYLKQAKVFDGPVSALTDAESLCAFGRFCDPNGQVWNQVERSDEPKIRASFVRQVENCPAGRLVAWDKATGKPLEPKLPVSIGLIEDPAQHCSGPLWLRGGISVISGDGFVYEVRNRITLCRCGQSRNKPFCDGTHAAIKFRGE
ncbi:MAG TPA: CDGSH iron-sulfur domain-containing protein [Stellaceae bacterium]|nr:CDGSH iron-sulfur domain-containing protein [Stellaceae bacterium]